MDLKITAKLVLDQLDAALCQMSAEHYALNISSLNASVSQHIRHILEFYICLLEGLKTGVVNYDNRERDPRIENDKLFALELIKELKEKISDQVDNNDLILELKYGNVSKNNISLSTNFYRELAYNIEHTIHHLAIIKPSIIEHFNYIELPNHFGIASSTVRYVNQKQN
jgi:uncharacterized damage-inducible protein DinB